MMTVTVIPNMTRECSYPVTVNLIKELEKNRIDYYFLSELKQCFTDIEQKHFLPGDFALKKSDIVIAVGGDGTIISAAKRAAEYGIPVLGINAGNLAYLMGLENDELELLSSLKNGNYEVEERIMLEVNVKNNGETVAVFNCINDAVVARGGKIQLASIDVKFNGKSAGNYKCDGILVSTPTGSTAYNLSAGGPVIEPDVDAIIITPICPHSITARPYVCSSDSVITVKSADDNRSDLFLSCDGENEISVNGGYEIVVSKSELKPKFIKLKKDSFLDILHIKLNDRL